MPSETSAAPPVSESVSAAPTVAPLPNQRRNSLLLTLNTGVVALGGALFWFLVARILHLDPALVGVGYATIALATTVAVLAKSGLDMAILRTVPKAHPRQ